MERIFRKVRSIGKDAMRRDNSEGSFLNEDKGKKFLGRAKGMNESRWELAEREGRHRPDGLQNA